MEWKHEKRELSSLYENPHNPRRLSKFAGQELRKSLRKFGQCEPVVIQPDGEIIGGHQRVRLLKKMGAQYVDVSVPESPLGKRDANELTIRLNKNTGDWDDDILANEWEEELLLESGFTIEELGIDTSQEITLDEEENLFPSSIKTQEGDLYQLGDHFLLCGDSTNEKDVKHLLQNNFPILMVADPPYGVNYAPEWRQQKMKIGKNAHISLGKVKNDDTFSWDKVWALSPSSVAYVWHASIYSSKVANDLENNSFQIKSQIIWNKQHFAISRGNYHCKHEPCWYAVKKGKKHNWQGSRKETTVWEISNLSSWGGKDLEDKSGHSTQKPLECMAIPIRNNSKVGEGVYDPFLGSGTTLIAAEHLHRTCFGMEIDPLYCDLTVNRWVNYIIKNGLEKKIILNGKEIKWEAEEKN